MNRHAMFALNSKTKEMKKVKLISVIVLSVAAAAVLMVSCVESRNSNASGPSLEIPDLADGNVNFIVPAEGGMQSMAYSIVNPIGDGLIEAVAVEDWIDGVNVEGDSIVFDVMPNEVPEARSSRFIVTYTYGEGSTVRTIRKEINIIQDAGIAYDYEFEMSYFSGGYYGTEFSLNGEHQYYTWISDMPFVDGKSQFGGTYYLFDIYGPAPGNEETLLPPAGTYLLGDATDEMTFAKGSSVAVRFEEDVEGPAWYAPFTEGRIDISYEEGEMIIDARLTDKNGQLHHVTFAGPAVYTYEVYEDEGPGILSRSIDLVPVSVTAEYKNKKDNTMEVWMEFSDIDMEENGEMFYPGIIMALEVYMPLDKSGYIAAGEYKVSSDMADLTVFPGECYAEILYGSYIQEIISDEEYGYNVGNIAEGTMTVSGGFGDYTIDCRFVTTEGYDVSCSYSGSLTVEGVPDNISTLEGDYTLNLEGAVGSVSYYGDYYGTGGGNWLISFSPAAGGDAFNTEIVAEGLDFAAGIPTGTYRASEVTYEVCPGEYLRGYAVGNAGYYGGTMLSGKFDGEGNAQAVAPAVSGDLNITNNGDGTYDFSFAFMDDCGNTWDGHWTGALQMTDYSGAPSAAPRR